MTCPRCQFAEISPETHRCVLCGYSPEGGVALEARARDATDELVRRELGAEFQIEAPLHQGPRATLYLARETRELESGLRVAVKVIPRRLLKETGVEDHFQREAAAAAALDHPHIVPLYRFGVTQSLLWYSMRHVEGHSLDQILRRDGPLEFPSCLRVLEQIASALHYGHRRGVVHGAVKPENVLLDANGWVLLADFAVSRVLARVPSLETPDAATRLEYLAPEASYLRQPGPSADQYSLAVLAYECLTEALPAKPAGKESDAADGSAVSPVTEIPPEIPLHMAEALRRALAAHPGERFPSVLDFVTVLESGETTPLSLLSTPPTRGRGTQRRVLFLDGASPPTPQKRRLVLPLWIGAALALVVGIAWWYLRPQPPRTLPPEVTSSRPGMFSGTTDTTASAPAPAAGVPPTSAPTTRPGAPTTLLSRPPATRPFVSRPPPARPFVPRTVLAPGHLFVNSTPWGQIYIDGNLIGNTPKANLSVAAGRHVLRLVHDGFEPYEGLLVVQPGQEVRLTDIVLKEVRQ